MDNTNNEKKAVYEIFEWVESAVFAIVTVVLIFTFIFRIVGVVGESMESTFFSKDRIVISKILYTPQRGDVVVLIQPDYKDDYPLIKRVIGIPGDKVTINEKGDVLINGVLIDEPYMNEPMNVNGLENVYTVGEDEIFVMGDNRNLSLDSRSPSIHNIKEKNVLGKAVFRIYPFNKFGFIKSGEYDIKSINENAGLD